MSGRTGKFNPTGPQIYRLSKGLLHAGADPWEVALVRVMLEEWNHGRATVSNWIDRVESTDPEVFGTAALEICRRADKPHYAAMAKARKEAGRG